MVKTANPIIIIPARMASSRLPNKPLADIGGMPMIVRVMRQAQAAEVGEVVVACDGEEIRSVVADAGGRAVVTDANLPSGSDRVWQALQKIDVDGKHDIIVNLQGDMPLLDPAIVGRVLEPLQHEAVDIATLAAEICDDEEKTNPAIVKIAISPDSNEKEEEKGGDLPRARGRALYFSRAAIPYGNGIMYHHIGIYAYRRNALERFVGLPPSYLERREKLEQLRALEAGMRIDVAVVDTVPLGVDTAEQLAQAQRLSTDSGSS